MFYEEMEMDGIWYWRGTPTGKWESFSPKQYARKIADLRADAERLNWLLKGENLGCVAEGNGRYEACWTYKNARETRQIIDEKRSPATSGDGS